MKTILVPVDLSEATVKVCDAACDLAKLLKARLVLLHVVPPPSVIIELLRSEGFQSTVERRTDGVRAVNFWRP